MIGLSVVNSVSKSLFDRPCGCSSFGCRVIRSTTLITRIFQIRYRCRKISTAARVSSVGTSPAQAITTSGSPLIVACPFPYPYTGAAMLDGRVHVEPLRHGCLPATITLIRLWLRKQWSVNTGGVSVRGK